MDVFAQQLFNGFSAGMSYALIALGLTLVFGVLHVVNFAHGELYMFGGVMCVVIAQHLGIGYLWSIPLAGIGAAVLGWIIVRAAVLPVISDRSDAGGSAILATYALSLLIIEVVLWAQGPAPVRIDGITGSIQLGSVTVTLQRILVIVVSGSMMVAVHLFLQRTSVGRDLRAVAQDGFAAQVVGVDVGRVRASAFILAGFVAGCVGALMVPIVLFTPVMGQHVLIKAFVVVVIGGMGSVTGAFVVGVSLGLLEVGLRTFMVDGFAQIVIYSLLVVTLLMRPSGLFGGTK